MAVRQEFPDNAPLNKAIQKRLISLAELTPEEMQEIETYEAQKIVASVGGGVPGEESIPPDQAQGIGEIDQALQAAGVPPTSAPQPA